jgi:hypothetical protein
MSNIEKIERIQEIVTYWCYRNIEEDEDELKEYLEVLVTIENEYQS